MSAVKQFPISLSIPAKDQADAMRKLTALMKLQQHLDTDVLEILAAKCHKIGINLKVKAMQHLI